MELEDRRLDGDSAHENGDEIRETSGSMEFQVSFCGSKPTRGQSATCRGVKYVSSRGISGDFRNPTALVRVLIPPAGI